MQILGICRFSYPAVGGFQNEHNTVEARCNYLYSQERLNMRFSAFETFTLPSIRSQSDPNFTFAILIGDSLPRHAKDRLYEVTANVPQIKIVSRPFIQSGILKTRLSSVYKRIIVTMKTAYKHVQM